MRRIFIYGLLPGFILLISGVMCFGQTLASTHLPVCDNYLLIKGESNINEFTFTYNAAPRTLLGQKSAQLKDKLEISIPIKDFEAENPMMYKDFLELMKEEQHPRIIVSFSRKQLESSLQDSSEPCPEINITIAGVTRTYNVQCSIDRCSDNLYLKGSEVVKLSDFKLKPPAKLMGLVKVNNEIAVNFGFIITFTSDNSFSATL